MKLPRCGFTGCLGGFVFGSTLLLALLACDNSHELKLYVFPDWVKLEEQLTKTDIEAFRVEGKELLVNGQNIVNFPRALLSKTTDYEDYHEVKSKEPKFHLVIKAHGQQVYEMDVESGAYFVNLSDRYDVWFAQVVYGTFKGTPQFLDRGKLGAYRLGTRRSPTVFKIDQEPPKSVRVSRTGTLSDEYFLLGTFTEKGMAMGKKLVQQNPAKQLQNNDK